MEYNSLLYNLTHPSFMVNHWKNSPHLVEIFTKGTTLELAEVDLLIKGLTEALYVARKL